MKESNQTPSQINRRKLLKTAAASAPLAVTLSPSNALAMASATQCVPTDQELSNKKFEGNGSSVNGDTAVRTWVPYYKKKNAQQGALKAIKLLVTGSENPTTTTPAEDAEIDRRSDQIADLDNDLYFISYDNGLTGDYWHNSGRKNTPPTDWEWEKCFDASEAKVLAVYDVSDVDGSATFKGYWPEYGILFDNTSAGVRGTPLTASCWISIDNGPGGVIGDPLDVRSILG